MSRLGVGVVGLGKMGLLHASILNTLPNVELVALCDKSALIRRICRKVLPDVRITDDLKKLSDANLDMIYVTTPIPSHQPIAKLIYTKEIANNIFVEKTLGASYEEALQLCELARTYGGANMVGYMKRFAVTFKKAKDLLDKNVLGDIISFDGYAYSSDFYGVGQSAATSTSRGGVLTDLGAHVVDLALWFFGELTIDSAVIKSLLGIGSEDSVRFTIKNKSGLQGQFNISWCMSGYRMPEFALHIIGSKGVLTANDDKVEFDKNGEKKVWHRHDLDDHVSYLLGGSEYCLEDQYFVKSVADSSTPILNFENASKVDQILAKVKEVAGPYEK